MKLDHRRANEIVLAAVDEIAESDQCSKPEALAKLVAYSVAILKKNSDDSVVNAIVERVLLEIESDGGPGASC